MNWYIAKLVFNIDIDNGSHNSQFDEQWRLVSATSPGEAMEKARALGRMQEECFVNMKQKSVNWKFIDVPDLKLQELEDGHELHSSTFEVGDAGSYINFVQNKALLFDTLETSLV